MTANRSALPPVSFEFFPPKTDEQRAQLDRTAAKLRSLRPEYVSVTFGAGGSTLSYTPETVQSLRDTHGLEAAPHLSCVGGSREEIAQCTARLVANRVAHKLRAAEVDALAQRLREAIPG